MADWISAFRCWLERRRRFAEEWSFHLEMSAIEMESLGMGRREARRMAKRRLGRRGLHRRAAARQTGADLRGLCDLLPLARARRGPLFFPLLIAATIIMIAALDPLRGQILVSMSGGAHAERFIPLTPRGIAPMGFAVVALALFLLAGALRMVCGLVPRRSGRVLVYAGALLLELALAGAVVWIAGLQLLLSWRWGNDRIQGLALCYFAFAYTGLAWQAMRRWRRDVELRCPQCLRLLGLHEERGKPHHLLVEPARTESICLYGHGAALESRWGRGFEESRAGTPW